MDRPEGAPEHALMDHSSRTAGTSTSTGSGIPMVMDMDLNPPAALPSSSCVSQAAVPNNRPKKGPNKRRRRVLSEPLFVAHVPAMFLRHDDTNTAKQSQFPHSSTSSQEEPFHEDGPAWSHFSQVLAALLLCTVLGLFSALDAEKQCLTHETYMMLDLVDDDNFQKAYDNANMAATTKCVFMFRYVIVPTGCATLVLAALSLILIARNSTATSRSYFQLCWQLLMAGTAILAAQTYNIVAIMLQPRGSTAQQDTNPYQSLAAVDPFGHVGDNANLYYFSWCCEGLALALVYQLATVTVRLYKAAQHQANSPPLLLQTAAYWHSDNDYFSWQDHSRAAWFQSLYRLRIRTAIWVAAALSCTVVTASSQYLWKTVLKPYATMYNSDSNVSLPVCRAVAEYATNLPDQLCFRTAAAWTSGVVAAALCGAAIVIHLYARKGASKVLTNSANNRTASSGGHGADLEEMCTHSVLEEVYVYNKWALFAEIVLSMLLSVLLGVNAVFTTGVQGPAATVGNLYYASWLSFLLCVRICLGCLEEYYDIKDESDSEVDTSPGAASKQKNSQSQQQSGVYEAPIYKDRQQEPQPQHERTAAVDMSAMREPPTSDSLHGLQVPSRDSSEQTMTDPLEKERAKRLRSYFFLGICSIVCAASGYDAASNQEDELSMTQKYMIFAPCLVAVQSAMLFVLCLSTRCYMVASHFCFGGLLSMLSFGLWLGDLILTMHSEDSWAVNGIGEIVSANLYYFSWAAILTAGLQMMSYVKSLLRIKKMDYMSVVWVAICKVCFVILGASAHIWHTISDK